MADSVPGRIPRAAIDTPFGACTAPVHIPFGTKRCVSASDAFVLVDIPPFCQAGVGDAVCPQVFGRYDAASEHLQEQFPLLGSVRSNGCGIHLFSAFRHRTRSQSFALVSWVGSLRPRRTRKPPDTLDFEGAEKFWRQGKGYSTRSIVQSCYLSKLFDRDDFLGWGLFDQRPQLGCSDLSTCFSGPDGAVGQEERAQISTGIWGQVQEEEVHYAARYMVNSIGKSQEGLDRSNLLRRAMSCVYPRYIDICQASLTRHMFQC